MPRAFPGYWTISEIAELFPGRDGRQCINETTVCRWITRGLRGVKLQAMRGARALLVTDAALAEFLAQLGIDAVAAMAEGDQ